VKTKSKLPKSGRIGSRTITFRIPDDLRAALTKRALLLRFKETQLLCEGLRYVLGLPPTLVLPEVRK
jgi:hypothetical protein